MDDQNLNELSEGKPNAPAADVLLVQKSASPGSTQEVAYGVERFSPADLITLRSELLQSGVDSFQAAEIVSSFLTGRGYGCSMLEARNIAFCIEAQGATAEHIQAELERIARVM